MCDSLFLFYLIVHKHIPHLLLPPSKHSNQFGEKQIIPQNPYDSNRKNTHEADRKKTKEKIDESIDYMKNVVWSDDDKHSNVRHKCKNLDEK